MRLSPGFFSDYSRIGNREWFLNNYILPITLLPITYYLIPLNLLFGLTVLRFRSNAIILSTVTKTQNPPDIKF